MPDTTDSPRFLHAMIRVRDLDASLAFYCGQLGMQEVKRSDVPEGKYTNVFVGYGPQETHAVIELTYNYGDHTYDKGDGFGHLAVGVKGIYEVCDRLAKAGVKITRPAGPLKFGTTLIAFIEDPDGYKIELVESDPN
ncbi:lactoylglutathione lyase [Acuticoccus sp. M5D2P5]|uniref:lactoylglutathione lyase n=1 Tax=Acuticoccus kalidii TaxID=2910977 RepID=UPI001F1989F7|nr:lactoylglutathione lyase [Acuticoccus kalidii]MCF3934040.1 lactoylglutathione lyase [Acuticoccus kalidii]